MEKYTSSVDSMASATENYLSMVCSSVANKAQTLNVDPDITRYYQIIMFFTRKTQRSV